MEWGQEDRICTEKMGLRKETAASVE